MAITNYLVHFKTQATYESTVALNPLRNDAVAFIKDATIIHTHGTDYYCGSGPVALESDLANYATTSALTSGLASKANVSHTHTISQISGLQDELNSKLESVSWAEVSGKPSTFTPATHTHSASDITSGTLSISRIPTGTTDTTVALGNHTHPNYLTETDLDGYVLDSELDAYALKSELPDLSDYALKTEIPDISNLATKTELAGYLPLTGGTLTGNLIMGTTSWINFGSVTISANDDGLFIDNDVALDECSLNGVSSIYGYTDLIIGGKNDPANNGRLTLKGGQSEVTLDQSGFKLDNDQILTEAN